MVPQPAPAATRSHRISCGAVRALRREKPVVASIAEVAASGGYYLASAADCVLAERSSITGRSG